MSLHHLQGCSICLNPLLLSHWAWSPPWSNPGPYLSGLQLSWPGRPSALLAAPDHTVQLVPVPKPLEAPHNPALVYVSTPGP